MLSFFLRYYSTHSKTRIQQVEWHPDACAHAHLVVLSSDNNLRIFDLDNLKHRGQFPDQTIQLSAAKGLNNSLTFGNSMISVKAALGDTAVAFAFGPSIESDEEGSQVSQV